MIVAIVIVSVFALACAVIYTLATRRVAKSLGAPTPDTAKIDASKREIVEQVTEEKREVANANAETLLQRVRNRVARGLRK